MNAAGTWKRLLLLLNKELIFAIHILKFTVMKLVYFNISCREFVKMARKSKNLKKYKTKSKYFAKFNSKAGNIWRFYSGPFNIDDDNRINRCVQHSNGFTVFIILNVYDLVYVFLLILQLS